MAQQIRRVAAHPEDLCLVHSTPLGWFTTLVPPAPGDPVSLAFAEFMCTYPQADAHTYT